jgi:hypothetical protein
LAAIVPIDSSRTGCRSQPTGRPTHTQHKVQDQHTDQPPSMPAGTGLPATEPLSMANREVVRSRQPAGSERSCRPDRGCHRARWRSPPAGGWSDISRRRTDQRRAHQQVLIMRILPVGASVGWDQRGTE